MTDEPSELTLPALRGVMGDWIYYSCLMDRKILGGRVRYARELHQHEGLSTMIQRQLDNRRRTEIADYLRDQPQRFFNSLVIATYDGDPNWVSLDSIQGPSPPESIEGLAPEMIGSIGFLIFRGDEKLFAVDGQHRLAGIRKVLEDDETHEDDDDISVIILAHRKNAAGLERTRRLFTTLNKTARPVSKGDIIALDEDDVMAICVRELVEKNRLFRGSRLAFVAGNNMPARNRDSLTTIGNLYDVLTILFTKAEWRLKKRKAELQRIRPPDETIESYFDYCSRFVRALEAEFEEVREFARAKNPRRVVAKYRGDHGGKVVFRPLGLELYATVAALLTDEMDLEDAVRTVARLPRDLHEPPYEGVLWDSGRGIIVGGNKVLLRELLGRMLGRSNRRYPDNVLLERYRRATGDAAITLPEKVL